MHVSHDCCNFTAKNKVKACQLGVMEALLDALSLHKANAEVARELSRALANICYDGIDQRLRSLSQQL